MQFLNYFFMKRFYKFIIVVLFFLFIVEFSLRFFFGFCDTVLIQESNKYEYIASPNQNRFRFRNHVNYNSFSMRSEEIDANCLKVLGFGDSVINGGVMTDQDSLATNILSKYLSKKYNHCVQFLNISAGSWGPDNCFAYLKEHGNFRAKTIYLFVSSHDAYDNMGFEKIVGIHESFPNKQYFSALVELIDRYLLPRLGFNHSINSDYALGINKKTDKSKFNSGFKDFYNYCKVRNIVLKIYLHATIEELRNKSFNEQGLEIIDFAKLNDIELINELDYSLDSNDYRDNIHLSEKGQKDLAKIVIKCNKDSIF